VHHKPVEDGDCSKCHTPHGSDYTALLQTAAQQICFSCHQKLGKAVAESKYRHGPVEENDCYACHTTHGSANPKILNQFFPAEFYNPYSTDKYALCFECHEQNIAHDQVTTTLTDFRNGDQNLHHLHINKPQRGRSCKACHEVHASSQARHIRLEVPYGKMWNYPINFTETETGGTCVVGCHKPKDYDRVNPVAYE
jgi:predicted CXXCH cytochrome family protein